MLSLATHELRFLLLPCLQASYYFCSFLLVQADTYQRAACIADSPVTPIPLYRHDMCSFETMEQSGVLCPWLTLLAFTPGAISRLVAVPRPAILGELLERYLMRVTVRALIRHGLRRAVRWRLGGWLCQGILPQEHRQPCQQPAFVRVTQGDLDLASFHHDVAVHTGRSLWQCKR